MNDPGRRSPSHDLPAHRSDELTRPMKLSPWVVAAGAAVTAGMFGMLGFGIGRNSSDAPPDAPPSRLALHTPRLGGSGAAALTRQIAITPDGSAVVYVSEVEDGENVLAYQRLDSESPVLINGGERVLSPEISEDGRSVTGVTEGADREARRVRVPMRGGTPAPVSDETDATRTELDKNGLRLQQMLDGNRKALVVRARPGALAGRGLMRDMKTGAETRIVDAAVVEMRYAAGHLVYVRDDGTLWAAPFEVKRNRLTDSPVQIGAGVALTGSGIAQFAVARNGNVAYLPEEPRWLVLVSRTGRLRTATPERGSYSGPQFSPDGRNISVDFTGPDGRDVWLVSVDQGTLTRATFDRDAHDAAWTPDGKFISYTSFRRGALGIYRTRPGIRAAPDSLFAEQSLLHSGQWLEDASGLVVPATNLRPRSREDIAFVANEGRGPVVPIVADGSATRFPSVSPDKRWLAYTSNVSGRDEVYVRRWNAGGATLLVSRNGGTEPVWNSDGTEILYRENASQHLIAAAVRAAAGIEVTARQALFPIGDMVPGASAANYDISPDGRTLAMVRRATASRIMVLQNLPAIVGASR